MYGKTNLYLFGAGSFTQAVEGTYEAGVTDFSNTDAHTVLGFGLGITSSSEKLFFTGLEVHYNMQGKVIMTDPSDSDTVEIDTYKNVMGFLTVGFNIVRSESLNFFVNGGGGVNYLLGTETATYTSTLGYETIIEPPERKYNFMAFGGAGVSFMFSGGAGVFASGRYVYVWTEDEPVGTIMALGGLTFHF